MSKTFLTWLSVLFTGGVMAFLTLAGGYVFLQTYPRLGLESQVNAWLEQFPQAAVYLPLSSPTATSTATVTRTPFRPLPTSTPTPTFTPTPTSTPTFTPSPTPTYTPTFTPTFTSTPTQTFTPPPTHTPVPQPTEIIIPDQVQIEGFRGREQWYSLDCEARSAVDLADFFGVSIDEQIFLDALPHSDDPNEGFVGSYNDARGLLPPAGYGVYAAPIAAQLRAFDLPAYEVYGMGWDQLTLEIASGRPVMVWVVNHTYPGVAQEYTTPDGDVVLVVPFEHTVVVTGYSPEGVTIVDGAWTYHRTVDEFLQSWGVLGNMAVAVSP